MRSPFALFKKRPEHIIIVSGLPRSGTSMMMKMLAAGGLPLLTDHQRQADDDNPQGYYELERVKRLPDGDTAWLQDARGKVVKVISQLLLFLPDAYSYRILFMRRNMAEVLASQRKMLERRGKDANKAGDDEMCMLFEKHLEQVYSWLDTHTNAQVLDIDYNQMIRNPSVMLPRIAEFLAVDLDAQKMMAVIDPALYRQRRGGG